MAEDLSAWYEARDDVFYELERELMGPHDTTPLDERPLNRIIVGVLHPRPRGGTEYVPNLESEESQPGGRYVAGQDDSAVALSHAVKPSSFGLTFTVDEQETPAIRVSVTARRYREEGQRWHPEDVAPDEDIVIDTGTPRRLSIPINDEPLRIAGVVRHAVDGQVRITISLLNTGQPSDPGKADAECWFRPRITVHAAPGRFIDRRRPRTRLSDDPDTRSTDFLYRNEPSLVTGHGCAVVWDEFSDPVDVLSTTFIPHQDVRLARPAGGGSDDEFGTYDLDMATLSATSDRSQLLQLAAAYESWISDRRRDADAMAPAYRDQAFVHIELAEQCASRIRAGITALDDPRYPDAGRAFQLMNEAMLAQRQAQDRARGAAEGKQEWRPFQIAFILMNLPGLVRRDHPDRELVDLLWFPTGGGKTEAYLGCIGFAILMRRLRRRDDGGVTAIMRYTLRLLTRQQFERAAGLICALELIRRRALPDSAPISLGLWVGDKASPNKVDDARKILDSIASGTEARGSTPVQLLRCPWCGSTMGHENYEVVARVRLDVRCTSLTCEFNDRLPVYVTDEDVYRDRPSLLIGTVDKFAMMTWRPEVGELLSVDGPHSRPDLIVQDELHLISGPLGTMVGLYESTVDLACTAEGRPKILGSTATIRRAESQVRNVFDRGSVQFPPPGIDPDDSYFAVDAEPERNGTRRYVGVMAPGTSQATLLVRVYSSLMQAVADLDVDDSVRDNYWTLLGYFNSLRVLGSTYLQVLDDVPDRVEVIANRYGTAPRSVSKEPVELTSRVDQTLIPSEMARLESSYPDPRSPDVVLATNMISVGLDINRLGLMVVAGQPQSTSEYIQSTSRVGRRHPGLVVVALNSGRSRDASHYESFIPFHRSLYREVEATTATPFASRARDRGSHGMIVAAARLLIAGLRGETSAAAVANHKTALHELIETLVSRAERIAPDEAEPFRAQLLKLVDAWEEAAEAGLVERYGALRPPAAANRPADHPLLAPAGGDHSQPDSFPVDSPPWPTLSSMRDVDAETELYVKNIKRSNS